MTIDESTFYVTQNTNEVLAKKPFEIVERKGLGHPDTICDALADNMSVALSKAYRKEYDTVLHFNLDKILLTAGVSEPKFGGGSIIKPIKIYLGDRATAGPTPNWVNNILTSTGKEWFKTHLRFNDVDNDVVFFSEVQRGSQNLTDIFKRKTTKYLGANDTSAVVGYYPRTPTEELVKSLEAELNKKEFKTCFPYFGEDIKLMAVRQSNILNLTMSTAFVDKYVSSVDDYMKNKKFLKDIVTAHINWFFNKTDTKIKLGQLNINALDNPKRGIDGLFMTVNGTSAESGDSGQVGRGNDANGIIPLCRPMASEAAPGKNAVSHVGKIYNALAFQIAMEIYDTLDEKEADVYCWLVSQIGKPINEPAHVAVQVNGTRGIDYKMIRNIVTYEFENLNTFCDRLVNGELALW